MKMRLFGKNRETLRIGKARACRAVYVRPGNPEEQEIEIQLITEDGERLDLRIKTKVAASLMLDMRDAYEAILPPMRRGNYAAGWQGMDD
jgi:hypothetical protein